ncbi:HET domain containing protein [Pyrenophora tritici-repentis]|nr:HET domain containing protein [Pyrenophora tritici-repentis]KAI1550520.1 HET domain containing protein [Pyrenophora tritici-repentis]
MFLSPDSARGRTGETIYPGAPLQANGIRLVNLLPGRWKDPILCELINADLGTARYRALSYVWGSAHITRPIRLNNRTYSVTINLESALRHLREKYRDGLTLWIDALCIDQKNVGERTHQVKLMGRIYAECTECIVYLGNNLDDTAVALTEPPPVLYFDEVTVPRVVTLRSRRKPGIYDIFLLFQELSRGGHPHETSAFGNAPEILTTDRRKTQDRLNLLETLRRFTHAPFTPWWTRIWVVQEIAAPPRVVVVYGTISAPWTMFAIAAREYVRHSKTCCNHDIKFMPRDELAVLEYSFDMIISIDDLRSAQQTHKQNIHDSAERMQPPLLLDLLIAFRDRKASDPRDKVYALLGMARTEEGRALVPDYSLSEVEVFRKVTVESIYATEDLSLFSTELGRKFRDDLPSWVPDWGAPGRSIYTYNAEALDLYNASPDKATRLSVLPIDQDALKLRATRIGTVQHVGDVMWGDDAEYNQRTLRKWWDMLNAVDSGSGMRSVIPHDLWRVLCADIVYYSQQSNFRRRTQFTDELMFIWWANFSRLSPFLIKPNDPRFWSKEAIMWADLFTLWPNATHLSSLDAEDISADFSPRFVQDACDVLSDNIKEITFRMIYDALYETPENYFIFSSSPTPGSAHPRKEAPWRDLFVKALGKLREHYGSDVQMDLLEIVGFSQIVEESIRAATLSRRMIVSSGTLGLAPAGTAVGDAIYILTGGLTPFVLRQRKQNFSKTEMLKYEIVGDCYLHERMDGNKKDQDHVEWIMLI